MRSGRAAFRVVQGGRTSRSCGLPPSLRRRPEGPRIHGSCQSSSTGKHLRRDGRRRRDGAPDGQRPRARRFPRLGVPHRGRRARHRGAAARRRGDRLRGRASRRGSAGRRARAADSSPLRQPVRVLLHRGTAARDFGSRCTSATTITASPSPTATSRRSPTSRSATSQRILEYRLSPLYVSVHATPWEARKILLNNPRVPNIVDQLTRLAAGGIQFHGQMVVVPGLNDGEVLEQSLTRSLGARGRGAERRARAGRRDAVLAPLQRPVRWMRRMPAASSMRSSGGRREPSPSAAIGGCSDPTSSICSRSGRCRAPSTTATSRRSRMVSARSPRSACGCARGSTRSRGSTASASASSPASRWRR